MLIIKEEQMHVLSKDSIQILELKCFEYIENEFSLFLTQKTNVEKNKIIRSLIFDAEKFNIKKDNDIIAFVNMCITYKKNYNTLTIDKKVMDIMENSGFSISEKIYLLYTNFSNEY